MTTEFEIEKNRSTQDLGHGESNATATAGLRLLAECFALGLTDFGAPTSVDVRGEWALLSTRIEGNCMSFAVMEPEFPGLAEGAVPLQFGLPMAFGLPSGDMILEKPDTFFYLPADFSIDHLFSLCRGHFSPVQFTELLNFSVRHAMSVPRNKFPKSILLMIRNRTELHDAGDKRFELWTQSVGSVRVIELKPTNNPHAAAAEANELGFSPTIYRCSSGRFVSFKSTDGTVFL